MPHLTSRLAAGLSGLAAILLLALSVSPASAQSAQQHLEMGKAKLGTPSFREGYEHVRKACEAGLAEGCVLLAENKFGSGYYKDGLDLLRKACDLGSSESCRRAGELLRDGLKEKTLSNAAFGQQFEVNPVQARNLLDRACNGDDGLACHGLADMLMQGSGGPVDLKKARRVAVSGCKDQSTPWTCKQLGPLLLHGEGGPVDYDGARAAFKRDCLEAGEAQSCAAWGEMMERGAGGPVDLKLASAAYVTACEDKFYLACDALGKLLALNNPTTEERASARSAFGLGCGGAVPSSCLLFGIMAYSGDGGPVDKTMARKALDLACQGDDLGGCFRLGMMQADGEGGPADPVQARANMEDACAAGVPDSCELLDEYFPGASAALR